MECLQEPPNTLKISEQVFASCSLCFQASKRVNSAKTKNSCKLSNALRLQFEGILYSHAFWPQKGAVKRGEGGGGPTMFFLNFCTTS
jgi:hypothetical protein